MAISVSFNGSTIYKPGSYSKRQIDLGGGFPLSPTGLIALFGEASAGAPGSDVPNIQNNVFTPDQMPAIKQLYRSGPIVDACNFLFAPGADGAIPSGAQAIYIYKTNASTQATLALANSWGSVDAREFGAGGNRDIFGVALVPSSQAQTASASTFDLTGGALDTKTLTLTIQGSSTVNTFTVPASTTTRALLTTALAAGGNWSGGVPSGVTFTVGGATDAAATLSIVRSAASNPHREGFGRNFELTAGSLLGLGAGTVKISAGLVVAGSEDMAILTVQNTRDLITETSTVGGNIVLKVGRLGGTTPQVVIDATQIKLMNNAVAEYTLNKADFDTVQQVADFITASTGGNWMALVSSVLHGQLNPSVLDQVTVGAWATALDSTHLPAQIKKDASEVVDFFAASASVSLTAGANADCGLPDALTNTYLAGGALGATLTADVVNALTVFQKVRVNAVVPLFSRDATDDFADQLTDTGSTYTIAGVHQAVKTHCSLMRTTKARSERQGYLSVKDTFDACKAASQTLADASQQLLIQDIKQNDSDGNIKWFQPWALACLVAGARGGSPVGLPMTNKYLNCSGIRQTAQAMSTADEDIVEDFDPDTQYEDAIRNGLTFMEHPQSGGFRVVVDNTTYGRDGNWVYNRAHVLYAADVLEYDFRTQLQNIYVGVKNTVSAAEIAQTCESILGTYLAQGLTVSTSDAKQGFKQLVVQLNGNTVNVNVTVKLVEGIDFVLSTVNLQRASGTAA
jgi:hypothetical protein